jgi:hypothetical protein
MGAIEDRLKMPDSFMSDDDEPFMAGGDFK